MKRVPRVGLVCFAAACKPVVEAPSDLDQALHATWDLFPDGTNADLAIVLEGLARIAAPQIDELTSRPVDGTQTRLTVAQLDAVDLFAPEGDDNWGMPDPALARPVFLLNLFDCTRAQLEPVLSALDQNAQYGAYDAYERTYTSSIDAFEAGEPTITWDAQVTASYPTAGQYTERLLGGLRRVPMPQLDASDPLAEVLTDSHAVLARTWIPHPAESERDGLRFEQDYQIELYLPWGADKMLHLYGVWRQLEVGTLGLDMESDGLARLTLNALADWDDDTAALCAQAR